MADKKISDFAFVTALAAVDTIPVVQALTNKQATLGQFNAFLALPTVSTVVSGVIPQTFKVVKIAGNCSLAAGTVEGTEFTLVSTAIGTVVAPGLLPLGGLLFTGAGATAKLIWANGYWNIISVNNMTFGVV